MLARKAALLDEGRPEAMAKLTKRGSLSARARIAALCDSDSFQEIGGFVRAEYARDDAPADGMILGTGKIDGRPVVVIAQDFSVYGGSSGHLGSTKLDRAATIALQAGIPLIMLLDGGGHRIQDGTELAPLCERRRHHHAGARAPLGLGADCRRHPRLRVRRQHKFYGVRGSSRDGARARRHGHCRSSPREGGDRRDDFSRDARWRGRSG